MDIYDITASALTAQRLRMDTIASNLANVNTTRKSDGTIGGYHRKNVMFAPLLDQSGAQGVSRNNGTPMRPPTSGVQIGPDGRPILMAYASNDAGKVAGVQVMGISEDTKTPMRLVYDPNHPDANKDGYVEYPNINPVTEMVDMISATRAYEANVTALQSGKSMAQSALEL